MITKSLQFGKALSASLLVILLAIGMTEAFAQTQVATLQHGDDVSVFYGTNAFVEANTAAQTGDIITLSSGTFNGTNITKAITLRGAGCAIDTVSGIYPTIIPNYIQLNVTDNSASLIVEGILFSGIVRYVTLNHPKFIKCNFEEFAYNNSSSSMDYAQIINCKFMSFAILGTTRNTTLINSVIWSPVGYQNGSLVSITAFNSFLRLSSHSYSYEFNAYNCIIAKVDGGNYGISLNSNSVAYNCIGIRVGNSSVFDYCQAFNCINETYSQIFETFNPGNNDTFSFDEPLILNESIATGFLGNDGTQVGIYGGIMPYSIRPSYMVIEHCNVANRSTIDGKLSVEIEVITEGE